MNEKLVLEKIKYILFTKKEENMLAYNTGIYLQELIDMPIDDDFALLIEEKKLLLRQQIKEKFGAYSAKINIEIMSNSGNVNISIRINQNTTDIQL
jgi:hypothetical protein